MAEHQTVMYPPLGVRGEPDGHERTEARMNELADMHFDHTVIPLSHHRPLLETISEWHDDMDECAGCGHSVRGAVWSHVAAAAGSFSDEADQYVKTGSIDSAGNLFSDYAIRVMGLSSMGQSPVPLALQALARSADPDMVFVSIPPPHGSWYDIGVIDESVHFERYQLGCVNIGLNPSRLANVAHRVEQVITFDPCAWSTEAEHPAPDLTVAEHMEAALAARRTRNTGPQRRPRAPRRIEPRGPRA
jgi:hypothetical protein